MLFMQNLFLFAVSSERSVEQVMVHTLQMELEGTRDTVLGLERRLDDLHEDLGSISRNVDSLLRLVSQSPNPMYLSSNSLQPSYFNQSPSPHTSNLYTPPSFYFSQSTMADTRELSSGQSNFSPAPESWSSPAGPGYYQNDQFLSPFQAPSKSFASPSPLIGSQKKILSSPGPMSNSSLTFPKQLPNLSNACTTPNIQITNSNNTPLSSNSDSHAFSSTSSSTILPKQNKTEAGSMTAFHVPDKNIDLHSLIRHEDDTDNERSKIHIQSGSPRLMVDRHSLSDSIEDNQLFISPKSLEGFDYPSPLRETYVSPVSVTKMDESDSKERNDSAISLKASPSPPALRGKSPPRPNKLSPLLSRRIRPSASGGGYTFRNSLDPSALYTDHPIGICSSGSFGQMTSSCDRKLWHPLHRSKSDSVTSQQLPVPPSHTFGSSSASSVNSLTLRGCQPFTSDYYHLTQLEPCDASLGHCEKAREISQSNANEHTEGTHLKEHLTYANNSPNSYTSSEAIPSDISEGINDSNNPCTDASLSLLNKEKERVDRWSRSMSNESEKSKKSKKIALNISPTSPTSLKTKSTKKSKTPTTLSRKKSMPKAESRSLSISSASESNESCPMNEVASSDSHASIMKLKSPVEKIIAPLSKSESINDEYEDSTIV